MTIDGVTFFSASTTYEVHVNTCIPVKVVGGVSFHVMAENWKNLKGAFAFSLLSI